MREVWGRDFTTLNDSVAGQERHQELYRPRLWTTITPVENIEFNARVVYEPRVNQEAPPGPTSSPTRKPSSTSSMSFPRTPPVCRSR